MKGGDFTIASTLHRRHMEIHAEEMTDLASCRSQLAHSTCTSEGIYTDSMFMVSDCRRIYLEKIEAAGRVACPGAPRVNFENCDRTLRGIWQEIMPELVREFSEPGPKCVTLPGLSLAYRVACLLFARSREERSALVATGFEPLVPRCPRPCPRARLLRSWLANTRTPLCHVFWHPRQPAASFFFVLLPLASKLLVAHRVLQFRSCAARFCSLLSRRRGSL